MILLLAHGHDPVANALQERISAEVSFLRLSPDQLVFAPVWVHEISESGQALTRIQLIDGREIYSSTVKAAYNRINRLEAIHFLNEVDRSYADMEFTALYYSFMKSLSASLLYPFSLFQMQADNLNEWSLKMAAMAAGLPVTDLGMSSAPRWQRLEGMQQYASARSLKDGFYHQAEHLIWENKPLRQQPKFRRVFTVFVAENQVFSDVSLPFNEGVLKLAAHLGSPYMELRIAELSEGEFAVYEMFIQPDRVHIAAIDTLAQALIQKALLPL